MNRKGIFNTNNFDDTSHARNMNIILPDYGMTGTYMDDYSPRCLYNLL